MTKAVQLTPSDLRAQAAEMAALRSSYEALFASVSSILSSSNDSWSPNLAHNFAGKITSAQKGFSGITDVLLWGQNAANSSAEGFESIDSALANALGAQETAAGAAAVPVTDSTEKSGTSLWKSSVLWSMVGSLGIVGTVVSTIGGVVTGGNACDKVSSAVKGVVKVAGQIAKGTSSGSFDWLGLAGKVTLQNALEYSTIEGAMAKELQGYSFSNATTVGDKIGVAAKWAGSIVTIASTTSKNFNDEENATISRKLAESVGESGVKILEGIVVGAGVSAAAGAMIVAGIGGAALAPVIGSAVAIGVATAGVTWAIDKICTAATGKEFAEYVSDTYIADSLESAFDSIADSKVGHAVKQAKETVSGWWSSLTTPQLATSW
jgi:hypothetical protein